MANNFLQMTVRRLLRNKVYAFINLVGLATGLCCFLLIATYVLSEWGYDAFHEKSGRIFRLTSQAVEEGKILDFATTPTAAYPEFKRAFPEVESGVRVYSTADFSPTLVRRGEDVREERGFLWADSTFFELFSFKLLQGDARTLLDETNAVVLTESTARRYFGNEDPMGKTLRVGTATDLRVSGIAADVPGNSQIKFDFVASFHSLKNWRENIWDSANFYTYLLLNDPAAAPGLEGKIKSFMSKAMAGAFPAGSYLTYVLQPMRDVHLNARVEGGLEPGSDRRYVYVFSIIALLILLIACINYINLTTARAVDRARETGIRKVVGAFRGQLFRQFLGESSFLTSIALVLGILGAYLLLPAFNRLTGRELDFVFMGSPAAIAGILGLGAVVSLISGGYPALVLSGFQPIRVLKGDFKTTGSGGSLRRGLVVFQFAVSFLLFVSTFVISRQMAYIQNRKLGYNKEQVLVLPADQVVRQSSGLFKNEFKTDPKVEQVTLASETPTFIQGGYSMWAEGRPEDFLLTLGAVGADFDFVKTLGLRLVAGADFTESDLAKAAVDPFELRQYQFILNETAVKALGWKPEEAIGKRARINGRKGFVKGVVADFHFASLHEDIKPLAIFITNQEVNKLMVKLNTGDIGATLRTLEQKWKTLAPHRPFDYQFLDQEFDALYSTERRTGKIATLFAGLAIFVACLGLFGLATFTAAQRTKEIGIRKALGASVPNLTGLLARDFLKLVVLGIVIASPIAYYFMNKWLEGFAYGIKVQAWMFVVAGLGAIAIALLTVGFQSVKAAMTNPVKSLRAE